MTPSGRQYRVEFDGHTHQVGVLGISPDSIEIEVGGERHLLRITSAMSLAPNSTTSAAGASPSSIPPLASAAGRANVAGPSGALASGIVSAPMPGILVSISVTAGQQVAAGQTVAVIEAMKMENNIAAPRAGTVKSVEASPGKEVSTGQTLLVIEPV